MYKAGARHYFDAVSLHPYAPKLSGITDQLKQVRAVMKANHDAKKRTLVTEIGWASDKGTYHPGTGQLGKPFVVTPSKQARNLTDSFNLFLSHRTSWKIGGIYWFVWQDPENTP